MTAQFSERLRYNGEDLAMCTNPLGYFFALGGVNPGFESNCTALWRGYVGSWEIVDGRLYLVSISGTLEGGGEASLGSVFPVFPDRVFAHWFSGTIRIPQGKMLEYVHMGYGSTYERDLHLEIDRGVVSKTTVRKNATTPEGSTEGYDVGAMTVSTRGNKDKGAST